MNWVIDRFEGGIAILENSKTLEKQERARGQLPADACEGDVLVERAGVFVLDKTETQARASRIQDRFKRITKR